MIEMATGRRFSTTSSNKSATPPGNYSSSSSSSSTSTSLRDGVVIVDIGNNSNNNIGSNNNNNNNKCYSSMSNQFVGGLSRMKRFQILLWIIIVFTFLHLRRNLPTAISPPQIEKKNNNNNVMKTAPTIAATTPATADVTTASPPSPPTSSPLMKPTSTTTTTTTQTASDRLSIEDSSTTMTTDAETIIVAEEEEEEDKYQKPTIVNNDDSDSEKQQPTTITSQPSSSSIIQVPQIINSEESLIDYKPSKKDENENEVNAIIKTEASIAPIILTKKSSSSSSSSTLPKVRTDNDLTPIERKFADTHCDLTHLKNNQWYPSSSSSSSSLSEEDNDDDDDSWQQRAPYIIIAGVWNAGINPIANALFKHPQIDKAKTNGFFLPKQFQRYYDVSSNNNDVNNINNNNKNNTEIASSSSSSFNIKVFAARERMYAQVYSKSTLREKVVNDKESKDMTGGNGEENNDDNKNNHVAMDVSPGLIFYAHKTAHSILCTVPWVKVVIVLRNPIDRLYQQWSYSTTNLGLRLSLEDWMAQEMKLLHTVGLIGAVNNNKNKNNNKDDKESVLTVVSEKEAWDKYQSVRNVAGAIGRSLYVLQLEEWINAYIAAGKNPSDFITILTTENIEDQPQKEYNKLIQFLHLAPIVDNNDDKDNIASTLLEKSFNKTKNNVNNNDLTPPMKEETRNMLRHFFQPYNQRLTKLLRSNGFEGNWDERWNNNMN